MDARLRSAGERWRSGTAVAEPSDVDPIELLQPTPSRAHRTLAMLSAAVVVAALVIGTVLFAVNRGSDSSPAAGGDPTRALQGVTWADVASGSTLVFKPGGVTVTGNCFVRTQRLHAVGHRFELGHDVGPGYLCGGLLPSPAMQRAQERFGRVVGHGLIAWSLSGSVLTLSAHGESIAL
ncbi:MAG TPA: hypothetical protein VGH30_07590, partial [Jatrophihabitantaceae bacterium]